MNNAIKIRYGITTSKNNSKHVWVDFGCYRWHSGHITDGNADLIIRGLRERNLATVAMADSRFIDRLVIGLALAGW